MIQAKVPVIYDSSESTRYNDSFEIQGEWKKHIREDLRSDNLSNELAKHFPSLERYAR